MHLIWFSYESPRWSEPTARLAFHVRGPDWTTYRSGSVPASSGADHVITPELRVFADWASNVLCFEGRKGALSDVGNSGLRAWLA